MSTINKTIKIEKRIFRKHVRNEYKRVEKLVEEALKWVTCPLGDVNGHIGNLERYLEFRHNNGNSAIVKHFEALYHTKSSILMNEYYESGADEMDRTMMSS